MKPVEPKLPTLGELELAVLQFLWGVEDANVAEVHAAVGEPRGITLNTVGSALERLFRKKLTTRHKVSHAYRYRAALAESELRARQAIDAVGGLAHLQDEGLLAAFVDLVAETDDEALDRLQALIDRKRGER